MANQTSQKDESENENEEKDGASDQREPPQPGEEPSASSLEGLVLWIQYMMWAFLQYLSYMFAIVSIVVRPCDGSKTSDDKEDNDDKVEPVTLDYNHENEKDYVKNSNRGKVQLGITVAEHTSKGCDIQNPQDQMKKKQESEKMNPVSMTQGIITMTTDQRHFGKGFTKKIDSPGPGYSLRCQEQALISSPRTCCSDRALLGAHKIEDKATQTFIATPDSFGPESVSVEKQSHDAPGSLGPESVSVEKQSNDTPDRFGPESVSMEKQSNTTPRSLGPESVSVEKQSNTIPRSLGPESVSMEKQSNTTPDSFGPGSVSMEKQSNTTPDSLEPGSVSMEKQSNTTPNSFGSGSVFLEKQSNTSRPDSFGPENVSMKKQSNIMPNRFGLESVSMEKQSNTRPNSFGPGSVSMEKQSSSTPDSFGPEGLSMENHSNTAAGSLGPESGFFSVVSHVHQGNNLKMQPPRSKDKRDQEDPPAVASGARPKERSCNLPREKELGEGIHHPGKMPGSDHLVDFYTPADTSSFYEARHRIQKFREILTNAEKVLKACEIALTCSAPSARDYWLQMAIQEVEMTCIAPSARDYWVQLAIQEGCHSGGVMWQGRGENRTEGGRLLTFCTEDP